MFNSPNPVRNDLDKMAKFKYSGRQKQAFSDAQNTESCCAFSAQATFTKVSHVSCWYIQTMGVKLVLKQMSLRKRLAYTPTSVATFNLIYTAFAQKCKVIYELLNSNLRTSSFYATSSILYKRNEILRNNYDRCYIFALPLCFLALFVVAFYLSGFACLRCWVFFMCFSTVRLYMVCICMFFPVFQ